jgi:UDP:flavonoid glycosyltransferase YjiC (YdhE family)
VANILFTWELGGNLGHLGYLKALMSLAARQGHSLSVALKNLRYADRVLGGLEYRCFQAPYRQASNPRPVPQSLSFAHTLEDFCFSDAGELFLRIRAWREIFDTVAPDLLYCDFSPGALIASRGLGIPRVAIGNGFMTPPPEPRQGVFAPYPTTKSDEQTLTALRDNDARLLLVLNAACKRAGVPLFENLGEIFGQADRRPLATLAELDHFGWRDSPDYVGVQPSFGSAAPIWPEAGERRVFCYLQDFLGLQTLLDELVAANLAVLVYTREPPVALQERFRAVPNLRFTSEAITIEALKEQAHFIVHHAGHGVAVQSFLSGLPQLSIPTQQEQLLTALQLDRAGVGETARHFQQSFAGEIRALANDGRYRDRAQQYRERYSSFSWAQSEARILADMAQLLGA